MNEVLSFSLVALLLVISPGPNAILVLKTATVHGRQATAINLLGITNATFCHGALSIFGLSALLLQSADTFLVFKILGAAYLFYVGAKAIYQSHNKSILEPVVVRDIALDEKKERKFGSFYTEGFLTQILNPKVSMFYLAAFPQFVSFQSSHYSDAFVLVAIHAGMIFCWFFVISMFINKVKHLSSKPMLGKWVQRLSGGAMIYFSSLLLAQKV